MSRSSLYSPQSVIQRFRVPDGPLTRCAAATAGLVIPGLCVGRCRRPGARRTRSRPESRSQVCSRPGPPSSAARDAHPRARRDDDGATHACTRPAATSARAVTPGRAHWFPETATSASCCFSVLTRGRLSDNPKLWSDGRSVAFARGTRSVRAAAGLARPRQVDPGARPAMGATGSGIEAAVAGPRQSA
jgi:hypothetical protein